MGNPPEDTNDTRSKNKKRLDSSTMVTSRIMRIFRSLWHWLTWDRTAPDILMLQISGQDSSLTEKCNYLWRSDPLGPACICCQQLEIWFWISESGVMDNTVEPPACAGICKSMEVHVRCWVLGGILLQWVNYDASWSSSSRCAAHWIESSVDALFDHGEVRCLSLPGKIFCDIHIPSQ